MSRDPPGVGGIREDVPHELDRIIMRCLRKDADRRIQHTDDVTLALQQLKRDSESGRLALAGSPRRPRAPLRKLLGFAAGLILLPAFGATAWWLVGSTRPAAPAVLTRRRLRPAEIQAQRAHHGGTCPQTAGGPA